MGNQESDWELASSKLATISSLPNDWDEGGADAFDPRIIRTASDLLAHYRAKGTPPPQAVVPSPDGSVVLEWYGEGNYVSAVIEVPGVAEVMEKSNEHGAIFTTVKLIRPITVLETQKGTHRNDFRNRS